MGNRCVITTKVNYENDGVGVYLHWNGGRDSVEAFLKYMELRGFRPPTQDCYGWARLCQVIGNYFGGGLSIGCDQVSNLDTEGDNGVYIIDGWKIVGRENFDWEEQHQYDLNDMLADIDSAQPKSEQLGMDFMRAEEVPVEDIRIGDQVFVMNYMEKYDLKTVVGFGSPVWIGYCACQDNTPYVDLYADQNGSYAHNVNNFLREKSYRVIRRSGDKILPEGADYQLLF